MLDKNAIIEVVSEWNFWERNPELGVIRGGYLEKIYKYLQSGQVMLVTGVRRSGKSYILRQMAKKLSDAGVPRNDVIYINFEDVRLGVGNAKELEEAYLAILEHVGTGGQKYVLLDEIQEVADWEKWVRTMHELRKAKMIVSGSNSSLLGRELGEKLTGRHVDVTVTPLDLGEFVKFRDGEDVEVYLRSFLEQGGFPLPVLSPKIGSELLLTYFGDILKRDIVGRKGIRKEAELVALARFVVGNTATLQTYGSLGKYLQISTDSAKKYMQYLQEAYLVFALERFAFKPKVVEKSPRKIYCIDTGLANVVSLRSNQNLGRLAENAVYLELLRRGKKVFYWKDEMHKEVDFLIWNGEKVEQMIQVCWNLADVATKERELKAIKAAWGELGRVPTLVLNETLEVNENFGGGGIQYKKLAGWLRG
jgi:uncharacterized protein